jgi:hypothetical protein
MTSYQPITLPSSLKIIKEETVTDRKIEDYIPTARLLLTEAGDDPGVQIEAIVQIVNEMLSFNNRVKMMKFIDVLSREFKIKKTDWNIALKDAMDVRRDKEEEDRDNSETSPLVSRVEAYITKRWDVYFNMISNKFMYREKGDPEFIEMNLDNIYRELQKAHLKYSLSDLKSLMKSDFTMKKNVFTEYFQSLPPWDGEDHIDKLATYIHVQQINATWDEQLRFNNMFKKMFVRMSACALEIGWNKQCFTLVHEKQNSGKSTFLRWITPPALEDYYTENIGTSKDDLIALTENIIINIDELSTLSKYDINALKSVMSKDRLKVRLPYGDRPEILKRRCSFVASTNRLEFLNDETGSVRWVCFLLDYIDWDYNKDIDINKVWAQAYHLLMKTDFEYQLNANEIKRNEEANKTFLIRSPEMELIHKYFAPATKEQHKDQKHGVEFMTASEIVTYLQNKIHGNIKLSVVNVGKRMILIQERQSIIHMGPIRISPRRI